MVKRLIASMLLAVALAACSTPEPDWSKPGYAGARQRIDFAASVSDCDALQEEFDSWVAIGNSELLRYIDDVMEEVGCYG